tara:strand:+ start:55 stop:216 length:162 start_codon:yes stop_codon:yes gene_type:complete
MIVTLVLCFTSIIVSLLICILHIGAAMKAIDVYITIQEKIYSIDKDKKNERVK